MRRSSNLIRTLGIVFFSAGILVNLLFFALLTWPGIEAYDYFGYQPAGAALTSLKCPYVLTTHETGQVTVTYTNSSSLTLSPQFRVQVSTPDLLNRTVNTAASIAPGETQELHWAITSNDVVFGRMILVEVYVSPVYDTPDRMGQCGTLWVDAPQVTGMQVFTAVLAAGLLLTALGWGLWLARYRPERASGLDVTHAMLAITAIVLLGMVAGLLGWWVVGVACLVLSLLLIIATLGHFIAPRA
ncbi:MAG: hypothetical protein WCE68_03595 [Anaerolineales bacterium]